jgi:TPR repeat protein
VLLAARPAAADLYTAQVAYEKGHYAAAFKEFRALAELGQPLAQHNLAVMYLNGQGTEQNRTYAYAWAKLSAEGGMEASRKLAETIEPTLTPGSLKFAQDLERQFNREALAKRLMPRILPGVDYSDRVACHKEKMFVPEYPAIALFKGVQGQVFAEFTVLPDGRARSPRIIYAVPPNFFEQAVRTSLLRSTFKPAMQDGKPVACTAVFLWTFRVQRDSSDHDGLPSSEYEGLDRYVKRTREQAEAGDARAQMLYGLLLAGLPQLNKTDSDALPWFLKAAQAGVPLAQYQVGYSLLAGRGCECEEDKAADWLRKAAEADQPDAQVTLARYSLRGTPDAEATQRAKIWLERAVKNGSGDGKLYLAALLAATPIDDIRDPKRATDLLDAVLKEYKDDPTVFEIRAAARANRGDFKSAMKDQAKAVEMAKKLGWDLAPQHERLERYRAQQAWHGDLLMF